MAPGPARCSAAHRLQQFLELGAHLPQDLLALRDVLACLVARESLARAADRESLVVEEAADLADHQHVLSLVVTAIAAPLHGFELRELLLPVTQHVRLDAAQ